MDTEQRNVIDTETVDEVGGGFAVSDEENSVTVLSATEKEGQSRYVDALDNWTVVNDDDTEELADEIGISGIYDEYGREIIKNVFENRLRLAPNSVKLMYSRLKNEILSYEGIVRKYIDKEEHYFVGEKLVFKFYINNGQLVFTIEKKSFTLKLDKKLKTLNSVLSAISKYCAGADLKKKEEYVPVAYAERYQFNPDAVLRDEEHEPTEGEYDGPEYDPIDGELEKDLLTELFAELEKLALPKENSEELRQQATTAEGVVALAEPIVFFYNVARTTENEIGYITVQEVLNDKFLGKMLPQQFFAIAESSHRIEELNLLSVEQAAADCKLYPDRTFVTQVSARLLIGDTIFKRLLEAATTDTKNLVLAFDCSLLEALGDNGMARVRTLAENDIKIMLDNTENAGLKVLTEYNIDYLRFDARYYKEENAKKTAHLDMLIGYAKVQGIRTTAVYVDTMKAGKYLIGHGVENIEGDIIGNPVRIVDNAIKQAKRLPTNS